MSFTVEIIGAGPSGLMAAEVLATAGAKVRVIDHMASPARKFLMAGRGGLNLTHSEPLEPFLDRYGEARAALEPAIRAFPPQALIGWCHGLGIETFVGSSGRVFPKTMKASPLLRAWLRRLDGLGVELALRTEWTGEKRGDAMILALGGASWPRLGSDAHWAGMLRNRGVTVNEFVPANCGVTMAWSPHFRERFAGTPLKRIAVTSGGRTVRGEAMITARGLEGGAIYRLGPVLRAMARPELRIDFKPQVTAQVLFSRAAQSRSPNEWFRAWKLSAGVVALLEAFYPEDCARLESAIARTKDFVMILQGPRPIAEAISTAGGVLWRELSDLLMLHKMPGVFLAGEMIDWEAPTGGYLLQGCFSTGTRAGRAAAQYAAR